MATLTVADDQLLEVDEYAKEEERSREDIVKEAIDVYLRQKSLARGSEWGREMARKGLTEDEVMDIINEEIHRMRAEQRNSVKYIECALAAGADYIISGDRDLLDLKEYGSVKIVDARGYLDVVGG